MRCPHRKCGVRLERTRTVLPSHERMADRYRALNVVRRHYRCPKCGHTCSTLELLEDDLTRGGWEPTAGHEPRIR